MHDAFRTDSFFRTARLGRGFLKKKIIKQGPLASIQGVVNIANQLTSIDSGSAEHLLTIPNIRRSANNTVTFLGTSSHKSVTRPEFIKIKHFRNDMRI